MATSLEHSAEIDQHMSRIEAVARACPHNGHLVNDERIERVLLGMARPLGDEVVVAGLPVPIWSRDSEDGHCDRCRNLTYGVDRGLYVGMGENVAQLSFCLPCAAYLDEAFSPLVWA
jgi:hypothetical protein